MIGYECLYVTNVNESGQVDIVYYGTHESDKVSAGATSKLIHFTEENVSKLNLNKNKRLAKSLEEARNAV